MEGKIVMLLVTLVCVAFFGVSSAKNVIVGGNTGWTIPSSSSFYTSWASQQSFQVGDVLVFNFPVGAHTVAEVSKPNYDSCNVAKTVGPVLTTGPANITLKAAGTHYFVCTITGHCGANQKLAVTVGGSKAATPAASPKKSPSPSPSAAPSPMTSSGPASSPASSPSMSASPPSPVASGPGAAGAPTSGAMSPTGASGPSGDGTTTPPPSGNSAASTGVSLLSLFSIVAAALVF